MGRLEDLLAYDDPRRAVAEAEPWRDVGNLSDAELVEVIRRDITVERFWRDPEYGGLGGGAANGGGPTDEDAEDLVEKHDVGFAVLDGNGDPYGGVSYVLVGPGDERETGVLGDDGRLDRTDVESEAYVLTLCDVAEAAWGAAEAEAEIEVAVAAKVVGYEDGDELEVLIYQRYAETDDDVIETLTATVQGGEARATWTYAHDREGPFATDHGVVEIIAEFRADADGPWAKTLEPLQLQLPTIDDAMWSDDEVAPEEEVTLSLSADGIPAGTPITIEVYKCRRSGEELLVADLGSHTVEGSGLSVSWAYPEGGGAVEAECFFVATLDGDPNRIAVSEMLTVSSAADDDDEDDDD